jgi:Resolvase, N terminal domain
MRVHDPLRPYGADKDSDKRQRQAIEAFARHGGYEIVEEFYDAAVSGADSRRKSLHRRRLPECAKASEVAAWTIIKVSRQLCKLSGLKRFGLVRDTRELMGNRGSVPAKRGNSPGLTTPYCAAGWGCRVCGGEKEESRSQGAFNHERDNAQGDSAVSSGQLEVDFTSDQVGDRDEISQ